MGLQEGLVEKLVAARFHIEPQTQNHLQTDCLLSLQNEKKKKKSNEIVSIHSKTIRRFL